MKLISTIAIAFVLFSAKSILAQKIVGYYPTYRSTLLNQIEFNKMTDVVLSFINFNPTTGAVDMTNVTALDNLITRAKTVNPNIRIHIGTGGGAFGTAGFTSLVTNATARGNFVTAMSNLIQTKNIDGWDLDWEYPSSTADKNGQQALLQEMRNALNTKELLMCKKLDISVAVAGVTPYYTNTLNLSALPFIDYIHVMAYDCPNSLYNGHSTYNFAVDALTGWNAWGIPYSKMLLGVPFYGWNYARSVAETYSVIANPAPATAYNSTTDFNGTYYYNAAPTLRDKVDLSMSATHKTAGIVIWELGQDRVGQTYSLLDAVYQRMNLVAGIAGLPADPCTLPVHFLGIDVEHIKDNLVQVYWETTKEVNNHFFMIEQSWDGEHFYPVGKVFAAVNRDQLKQYQYQYGITEENQGQQTLYVRIKQVDYDGQTTYSESKSIALKKEISFSIYPNPSSGVFTILFYDLQKENQTLKVFTPQGQVCCEKIMETFSKEVCVDLSMMPKGFYTLVIQNSKERKIQKLIVQ